ncbi:MAG: segregation/condensation protein A [Deferribacteraceae bacterium]|jgi:segregation and condensation protein A|nr:segregation/condensation protein A [Deferribacteraceae bacterium]
MTNLLDVQIDNYEGPLDLLIHLVHRNEMNIFDVPISVITDHFVAEVRRMQSLDMEVAAEFIQMASYLIYLKSRSLLPRGTTEGEELSIEEESFNLAQLLVELAYCKELAIIMRACAEKASGYLTRREGIQLPREKSFGEDPYKLADLFFEATREKPDIKVVVNSTKGHSDKVAAQTKTIILSKRDTMWSELTAIFPESFEKAVAFATILDISKQQLIRSIQESNFSDILMQRLSE